MRSSARNTAPIRSISLRHSAHSSKCIAISSRSFRSPSRYPINSSSVLCFMILFPLLLWLDPPQRAPMPAAVLPPRGIRCSSLRSRSSSALRQSPQSHSLPSAASRWPCAPPGLARPTLLSSLARVLHCPPAAPGRAVHLAVDSADPLPSHFLFACPAVPSANLPPFVAAAYRSRNSPQSGRPTSRNSHSPRTDLVF